MFEISLNVYYTIAIAVLVLLLGDLIKKHVAVLRKFCIPTPVVGGVIFSVAITVLNVSGVCTVSLDSSFNEFFSLLDVYKRQVVRIPTSYREQAG